jgi:hypothetical protein
MSLFQYCKDDSISSCKNNDRERGRVSQSVSQSVEKWNESYRLSSSESGL